MAAFKDSGVEWIGKIPEDWNDCVPLRFCATLNSATSPFDPDKPYLALENISSWTGKVMSGEQPDQVDSSVANYSRSDVLFGKLRPYLAKVVRPTADGQCSTELLPISPTSLDRNYLFWLLINKGFIDTVNSMTYGVKMPRTNWLQLGALYCPIPPRKEQADIAAFLDNHCEEIDNVSQILESQIKILEHYRASVVHEAVTRGLIPNVPTKPSGVDWIGDIPAHWQAERISYHCRLESGHTPSKDHPEWWKDDECVIPWLTTGDIHRFRKGELTSIDDTEEHISETGLAHSSARILPAGTVALSRTASVGFSIIMGRDMATSQDFADWVPGPDVNSKYLLYVFRSMSQLFEQLKIGSTHKTIYMHVLKTLKMPLPPISEQLAIAGHLDARTSAIDAVLETKRKQLDNLKRRRQSLIYEYVTGKRRVAEEE
ncbi:MAG: restriction endonuclease subunit S [Parolsenella sp.]|uniref:restriction endonuclease subunit S n=1 Tax=Parolsenella sp. TaxID=2083006 RepID=UPI002A75384E|nr:restriction endonuclease subunit S [Parolsenella sp.]MCI5949573.1 restriction endonuclease subunit S [Coriobacteriaceae bacterium]MDY3291816.1 restriction endonuclease subunit S [Parolsenella sp.]